MPGINGSAIRLAPATLRARMRRPGWLLGALGIVLFAAIFGISLLKVQRSYVAETSLSFAQTKAGSGGLLASMTGMGGGTATKYIGVLRSHRFAEMAEDRVHLQSVYGLRTHDQAVDMLQSSVAVTDNPRDGLLYISATLKAPPFLARHSGQQRQRIQAAAIDIANVYADLLQQYIATSDTDADAILLQEAGGQIQQARANYDHAVTALSDFVRKTGVFGASTSLAAGGIGASGSGAGAQGQAGSGSAADSTAKALESLYATLATLEAELQSAIVAAQAGGHLRSDQLSSLRTLPSEDPLLMTARNAVNRARIELLALQQQYGPEHPRVMIAQDKLRVAEAELRGQVTSIRQGRTTDVVEAEIKRRALQARYDVINRQIAQAEQKAQIGRQYLTEYERLRNEILLRLEVLKTTASQTAVLSLQVVSAQNRVHVVDPAYRAHAGSPSMQTLAIYSLTLTVIALLACWYLIPLAATAFGRQRAEQVSTSHAVTGAPAEAETPAAEGERAA
jgi:uncharacterized protein involved in exopolysaccharide biosynthesis